MNRFWLRTSALCLCLVNFIAASSLSRADELTAGEKLVPKDALVFFSISNVTELKKKWDASPMGRLLQEPKLKPFLDDVYKRLEEESKQWEEEIGLSISNLLDLPNRQLTLVLLERPSAKLSLVAILEYGEHQSNVDKLLKEMDESLEKEKFEHSTEDIEKIPVHIYSQKGGSDTPFNRIAYFTDKSSLVFSTELDALKEVLSRWDGNSDDTLAENDEFKYIQQQCKIENGDGLIKVFANPSGLITSGIAVAQTSFPQAGMALPFISVLGLDGLKGWGGLSDFDEGDFEFIANFYIYADAPKGLLGIFNFPAAQLMPPKWVPANVASYFVLNWNIQGAYKAIESLSDMVQGPGATARILDSVAEQGPMIHPKKDLIDHLDGKIHFMQAEPKDAGSGENLAPGFFVGFGLKDAAKMKKTLAAAAKAPGSNLESRDFNGETIYEASQPGSDQSISFAVAEGNLVLTNDTPMLEGVLRGQSGRGLALIDSPDYKKIAKLFPSKASMLSFQRGDVQMKMYYDLAKKAGADAVDGIDFSKLPSFDVIAKYMVPSGGFVVPDKKGAKSVSFSLKRSD